MGCVKQIGRGGNEVAVGLYLFRREPFRPHHGNMGVAPGKDCWVAGGWCDVAAPAACRSLELAHTPSRASASGRKDCSLSQDACASTRALASMFGAIWSCRNLNKSRAASAIAESRTLL